MAWYTTGTVDVTNGAAVVSGNGTSWFAGMQVGWVFVGPDGRNYEVIAVASDTALTLGSNYQGSTASAQTYGAFPTTSIELDLVTSIQSLIGDFGAVKDGIGQGKMPDDMVFESDPDTGLSLISSNKISLKAGNSEKLTVSGNVASGDVVQSNTTDDTAGKLMAVGAFGVGSTAAPSFTDANLVLVGGTYGASDATALSNIPAGLTIGPVSLVVIPGYNSSNFTQIISGQNDDMGIYRRRYRASTFFEWREIISLNDIGDLAINTDTLFVDVSTGRVGIGATSPESPLHVEGAIQGTNLISTGTGPKFDFIKTDDADTHERTRLLRGADTFKIATRDSTGSAVSSDYEITIGANGATQHEFNIEGASAATIDSAKKMTVSSGLLNLNGNDVSGENITIADNAVGSFTPPRNGGYALVSANGNSTSPLKAHSVLVFYDVGASLSITVVSANIGTSVDVVTTDVTGTSGTDGNTTVSVQAGVLKIENRRGSSADFQVSFL